MKLQAQKDHQQLLGFDRVLKFGFRQLLPSFLIALEALLTADGFWPVDGFSNGLELRPFPLVPCWLLPQLKLFLDELGQGSPNGLLLGGLTQLLELVGLGLEGIIIAGLLLVMLELVPQFLAPLPVPFMYFYCILEGFIPPGLLMILAHLGMCLYATSAAYLRPQCLHSTQWSQLEGGGGGKSDIFPPLASIALIWRIIFIAFCSSSCWIFHLAFFSLPKLGFIFDGFTYSLYSSFFWCTCTRSPLHTFSCLATLSALNFLPHLRQGTRLLF